MGAREAADLHLSEQLPQRRSKLMNNRLARGLLLFCQSAAALQATGNKIISVLSSDEQFAKLCVKPLARLYRNSNAAAKLRLHESDLLALLSAALVVVVVVVTDNTTMTACNVCGCLQRFCSCCNNNNNNTAVCAYLWPDS